MRSEEFLAPSSDEPATNFSSDEDEMFGQAPIFEGDLRTVTFKTVMIKAWELISAITRDLD